MCFGETVFLYACVSAKLKAARKERERVISEQFSSTHEIGSAPPSCPTQVWSEGAEKRKGDQMHKSPSLQHQKRRNDVYKPVAHLPEKVSQCETNNRSCVCCIESTVCVGGGWECEGDGICIKLYQHVIPPGSASHQCHGPALV